MTIVDASMYSAGQSQTAQGNTAQGQTSKTASIIRPGRNAWREAVTSRAAFLVDGAEYYQRLAQVLAKAEKSIFIVGWDFNPHIRLTPEEDGSPTLGEILRAQVEAHEGLIVRILVWGMGPIYSGKSFKLFQKTGWNDHPRIKLEFDFRHPVRASHHQKMVAVDDAVAFLGGIDLTARRWDDRRHAIPNALRCSPDGTCYGPVHDLQAILAGDGAVLVGDAARKRWKRATGEVLNADPGNPDSLWPQDLAPSLTDCPVALALTEPLLWNGKRGRREAVQLTHDALRAARRHIYLESQYLASFTVARTLAERLQEPDGPEIVILVTRESHGLLEKLMMGHNRNRLIRRLKRLDRYNRLRVYYAVTRDGEGKETEIIVHSKLVVIDDRFVRIGSSNLNNRSEGLDTESDIAFEPTSEEGRRALTALRDDLIAEHLEASPADISASIAETGSLIRTIEQFNSRPRGLRPFVIASNGETESLIGTSLADPRRPFWPFRQLKVGTRWALSRLTRSFT
ncbi:phosphatidylserine/phosphatidylglycerophosphate/cardiolipin synthase-like enzyme [Neorhizobium galegae]|uniref:phospholipase D-like domain-containing protein n=1 Tax=Neorhizobium galegae TaxID=399 RepID=UPI0032AF4D48|nr:phosphatidylserine/phosphatidylglycerophosphate/cardiolipin synthase-like enzyme [Neorhizobium galegae]